MADGADNSAMQSLFDPARRRRVVEYWVRDTAFGILNTAIHHGLRVLPIDACSGFGAMTAKLTSLRHAGGDANGRNNWKRLRPGQSDPASVDAAMSELWRCITRTMMEFSVLDRLWKAGRIEVEGAEHLHAARAAGRPILGTWLHLGNWEVIGVASVGVGHPGAAVYLPPKNRFDHRIVVKARERYGAIVHPPGPNAMRAAVRMLTERAGQFVIFADETMGGRIVAPSFDQPHRIDGNLAFAARLAAMTGAEIIPAYCLRIADSAHFKVTFMPPVEIDRTGKEDTVLQANVGRLNAVIEPVIQAHLEQWILLTDFAFPR